MSEVELIHGKWFKCRGRFGNDKRLDVVSHYYYKMYSQVIVAIVIIITIM